MAFSQSGQPLHHQTDRTTIDLPLTMSSPPLWHVNGPMKELFIIFNIQLLWKSLIKSTISERQISLGIIYEVNLSAALHLVCNICSQRSLFYETASPGRTTPPSRFWCLSRHNCDCAASRAHPPFIPQQSSALWLWAHSLICLPWSIFEQISPGFPSAVGAGKLILTMFTFPPS